MSGFFTAIISREFEDLNINHVINVNNNRQIGFYRAFKVFLMSYPYIDPQNRELYNQKLNEFFTEMKILYEIPMNDLNFVPQVRGLMAPDVIDTIIGVIKYRSGADPQLQRPRVTINNGVTPADDPIDLDTDSERQYTKHRIVFRYKDFCKLFEQNRNISIDLYADNWQQFNRFSINYRQIHCEGYEEWVDFGHNVHLLIRIEFLVSEEPKFDEKSTSDYHFHTILYMIEKSLNKYRNSTEDNGSKHRTASHRSHISYIRKRVVNPEDAYWPTPQSANIDVMQSIRSSTDRISRETVKYCDIQIPHEFEDSYEDTICLCNQWCNWNAFFHFNPIYRFLLVQHNRLYLMNKSNVPDMYLFAGLYHTVQAIQTNPTPKVPLFQLIGCANSYRKRYNDKYYSNPSFKEDYQLCEPSYRNLNGMSYKMIRQSIKISKIYLQWDSNPYSDTCIENIIHYYTVLVDLHHLISTIRDFHSIPN